MWEAAPSHLHRDWVLPAGCGAQPWLQNTWEHGLSYSSPISVPHCSHSPHAAMEQECHPEPSPTRCFTPSHFSCPCMDHGHHLDTNRDVLASPVTSSSLHLLSFIRAYWSCGVKTERKKRAQSSITHCPLAIVSHSFHSLLVLRSFKPLTSPIFPIK